MFWLAAAMALVALLVSRHNVSPTTEPPPPPPPLPPPLPPPPPLKPKTDGECIFWIHKTPAAFECAGYCDHVARTDSPNIRLSNARILDLSIDPDLEKNQGKPRGIAVERELIIPVNDLHRLSPQPMGGLVLYHLTADGILDDGAGRIMFPGRNASDSAEIRMSLRTALRGRHESGAKMTFWTWLATLPAAIVDVISGMVTGGEVSLTEFFGRKLAAGNFTILRTAGDLYQVRGSKWATYWRAASPYPVIVEISPAGVYYDAKLGER